MIPAVPQTSTQTILRLDELQEDLPNATRSGIRAFVLFGLVVVTAFIGGAAYWAASSKLDGAVVAPASLVVEGNRRTVEHLEGGIVTEIHVADGDLVEAGQTLLVLDDTDVGVDLDVIESQLADLVVRRARLQAQLAGNDSFNALDVTAAQGAKIDPMRWQKAFVTQKLLFDAETRTRDAEAALTAQQIASLEADLEGLRLQRDFNAKQLDITLLELEGLESLLDKGLVAVTRVNGRRVDVERLNGLDASLRTQEVQAHNEISELRLASIEETTQRDELIATELAEVEAGLAALQPQFLGAKARLKRVAITAPVAGRVVEMKVFTAGGVVRPGAPILDIVPLDEPLIVEARVNTVDIEKLHVGQASRVRLSAFDQTDIPEATGRIVDISADSLEDDRTGQFYYTARVTLDEVQNDQVASLDLLPGMPADLFVNTGERTALTYLTQPLRDRLVRTFIE